MKTRQVYDFTQDRDQTENIVHFRLNTETVQGDWEQKYGSGRGGAGGHRYTWELGWEFREKQSMFEMIRY